MCLIVVAHRSHTRYPLVVAANRDEFHARPTAAADFWEGSEILGGRDLQSGGTWLGVTRSGRFAVVTNFHEPREKRSDDLSRGMLVRGFLESRETPRQFLEGIAGDRYAGFGLFVSDLGSLGYLSNRAGEPRILPPGIYALSNHLLDTDWGKVRRGKAAMSRHLRAGNVSSALLETLREREDGASREEAIFVLDPVHGTRSSTVVTVDSSGALTFVERGFDSAGRETYIRPFGFRGVSAASEITPAV